MTEPTPEVLALVTLLRRCETKGSGFWRWDGITWIPTKVSATISSQDHGRSTVAICSMNELSAALALLRAEKEDKVGEKPC